MSLGHRYYYLFSNVKSEYLSVIVLINLASTPPAIVIVSPPLDAGMNIIWNRNRQTSAIAVRYLTYLKESLL